MYSHRHVEPLLVEPPPLNSIVEPPSCRAAVVEPLPSCLTTEPMSSRCCLCRAAARHRLLLLDIVHMVNHLSSEPVQRHESSTLSSGKTFACGHTPAVL
ncbi:hypothetical protein RB195_015139 [Necator americanus]|uniref:Uncharacterized protein n=1 Tax=Necator americanus TaxID=51031 RepID=A0ABR1E3F5_NECAM